MYWANFLHIYQPPTQTKSILDRVVKESYRKVLSGLLENPEARATINVPACLAELLAHNGYGDVLEILITLAARGQVELTATAAYHGFLPKLPKEEVVRQIKLDLSMNRKYLGESFSPTGFFPPEMAYSPDLGKIVAELGFKWIILDELALPPGQKYDPTKTYVSSSGLRYFFRERGASFKILSAQLGTEAILLREFGDRVNQNQYLLTAMDGETFGHHRLGLEKLLVEIYQDKKLPTVTVSNLLTLFPESVTVEPVASTWAVMDTELLKHEPFARWDDPMNKIHHLQWELVGLAIKAVSGDQVGSQREMLDKAVHSDQFWWASARPWWSLEMIERGASELLGVVKGSSAGLEEKDRAQQIYYDIITQGFAWQRDGTVENLSRKEDEEIRARMMADKPQVSRADYDQMITTLGEQMKMAAGNEEYARAELFRKRIAELTAERDKLPNAQGAEIRVNQ